MNDTILIVDDESDLLVCLKRTIEMELNCNLRFGLSASPQVLCKFSQNIVVML
jgi:hypothetical protein